MKKLLFVGGLIALGALGGGPIVSGIQHAVSGPACTLRWSGSNAYMVMNGPDAYDACKAATGLSGNLVQVDDAPSLPTVCRYTLPGDAHVAVRDSSDEMVGSELCNGQ